MNAPGDRKQTTRGTIRSLLIALGLAALGLTAVAACGIYGLKKMWEDPPPKLTAPLRLGMTIAEVGRARPTEYELDRPALDPRTASKSELMGFNGWIEVSSKTGVVADLPFKNGRHSGESGATEEGEKLAASVPQGANVQAALKRIGPGYDVTLYQDDLLYDLPEDAPRLKRFTGTLIGRESTGWTFYAWYVTFRNGIVTDVQETVDYD